MGIGEFSMRWMIFPRRSARGTPRRRIPTRPRASMPPFFSTISWARRTRVRSTSEADMSCAFWRNPDFGEVLFVAINGLHDTWRRPGFARKIGTLLSCTQLSGDVLGFSETRQGFFGGDQLRAQIFKFLECAIAFHGIVRFDGVSDHRDQPPAFE